MYQFPMIFKSESQSPAGMQTTWKTHVSSGELSAAIPPEFRGPGGGYSPEDFYVFAVVNCFVATFKVLAQNSKIDFQKLDCEAHLTVDKNERGQPEFKSVHIKAKLSQPTEPEKAKRLLEKTSSSCLVANSLKIEKTFELEVI